MENRQNKLITIIMVYLNEGNEPRATVDSIYATADPSMFNIVAIDDCSDHEEDQFTDLKEVTYVRNTKRMGHQAGKDMGVSMATTPYILLIDAHMRFRNDNWCEKIVNALKAEPNTIFGVTCLALRMEDKDIPLDRKVSKTLGARLRFFDSLDDIQPNKVEIIFPRWLNKKTIGNYSNNEIPCVLGACYGISREFYLKIDGLKGLKMWGSTEAFLSLKTWFAGGKCKLIREIEVGHKFRKAAPYVTNTYFGYYNQLFLIQTLFPKEFSEAILQRLPFSKPKELALMVLEHNKEEIEERRNYFKSIFKIGILEYCEYFNIKLPQELVAAVQD